MLNFGLIVFFFKFRVAEGIRFWRFMILYITVYKILVKVMFRRFVFLMNGWVGK